MPANDHNRFFLQTKALKSGHLIDLNGKEHLPEQADAPVIEGMSEDAIAAVSSLYSY
jgi:GTP cyclohydrolase II